MTTRLHIDWTACTGRGLCAELLPEVFDTDDWGYPVPRDAARDPAVPAHLRSTREPRSGSARGSP